MSSVFTGVVLTALLALPQGAQQRQSGTAPATSPSRTLNGCVSQSPGATGEFTFLDADSGSRYRLTGRSVRRYAGQRVEIIGGPNTKRLTIRLGLVPSPNVAAQASAMDPAQRARANLPGGAADSPSGPTLPEFRVITLRAVAGGCR
jgi:hypothetical protein